MRYYYHVRVSRKNKKDLIELDLTKTYLMTTIVKPYKRGEKFACGSDVVNPSEITDIEIRKTEEDSEIIIQKIQMKKSYYFGKETYADRWLVTKRGRNVTNEFIRFLPKQKTTKRRKAKVPILSKKVFIVHGKDRKSLSELKTILKKLGLAPIVLHEQPSGSRTIVEKLEKYSDVGYAFVILTPDDVFIPTVLGHEIDKKKGTIKDLHFLTGQLIRRARQNVVLEFGYFMNLLGRDRVCCLYKGDVELPSDMHGIVYIPFKESVNECRDKIIKELRAVGYEIRA